MFTFRNTKNGQSPRGRNRAAALCAPWTLAVLATFVAGCPSSEQTETPVNETPAVSNKTPDPPPRAEEPADPLPIAGRTHVVQPHDTLYKLAEQYYGNSKYYRKILSANKRRLKDPNNLQVGMKLIIP